MRLSRLDLLNKVSKRIKTTWSDDSRAALGPLLGRYRPLRARRRHCPGVMPILSVNTRRNDDTD